MISFLALLGAWGGPAVADRLVTGADVKNGSLAGRDVKNGSLAGRDVKDRSLAGRDMRSNSVTGRVVSGLSGRDFLRDSIDGSKIAEETLDIARAANADHAVTADSVAGTRFARLHAALAPGATATVLEAQGLKLTASCSSAAGLTLGAATAGGPAAIRVSGVHRTGGSPTAVFAEDDDFAAGEDFDALAGQADNLRADLVYAAPDGAVVTASYLAEEGIASPPGSGCLVAGSAVLSSR